MGKNEATSNYEVSGVQKAGESTSRKQSGKDKKDNNKRQHRVVVRVDTPTEFDILCGQSRFCANHRGNKCFSVVLDQFAERYDAATSKHEKMKMTKEVVA